MHNTKMKKNRTHCFVVLILCTMFVFPAVAQEDSNMVKEPSQIKQFSELFIGLGSWQNVGLVSAETYRTGGFHLVPAGAEISILFPRLPFGVGFVCYQNYVYREIEQEGSSDLILTKRPSYYFAPKISWDKFFNEHHSIHFSASAGLLSEGYKVDDPDRWNVWKYDNYFAGMLTASYSYLINGKSGIGLRASLLSYGNGKGSTARNPLLDGWSIGISYVYYGPW